MFCRQPHKPLTWATPCHCLWTDTRKPPPVLRMSISCFSPHYALKYFFGDFVSMALNLIPSWTQAISTHDRSECAAYISLSPLVMTVCPLVSLYCVSTILWLPVYAFLRINFISFMLLKKIPHCITGWPTLPSLKLNMFAVESVMHPVMITEHNLHEQWMHVNILWWVVVCASLFKREWER